MALIPDTSAIVSLAFDDEDATYAQQVIEAIATDLAVVPTLFWFEIRNVLLMGERRKRSTVHQTKAVLSDLSLLPFEIDSHPLEAAYLELAQRRNLPLATVDRALIRAAKAAGVAVWQEFR